LLPLLHTVKLPAPAVVVCYVAHVAEPHHTPGPLIVPLELRRTIFRQLGKRCITEQKLGYGPWILTVYLLQR
jgi:hypothetical protein